MNDFDEATEALYAGNDKPARVPPAATDVEMNILGGMLMEQEAAITAFEKLKANDFYKPGHQTIFALMLDLFMDDKPLDLLTIESGLRDKGQLDSCGGAGYIRELTRSSSSSANIEYHAQIVIEKSKRRKLIRLCDEIQDDAYRTDTNTFDVLDKAENLMFELSQDKESKEAIHVRDKLQEVLERYEIVMDDPSKMEGIFSGLDIDDILTGFKEGNFYVLAARPSMGKSALALEIADGVASGRGGEKEPVAFFSLEMSCDSLVDRLILMESHINGQDAKKGEISREEFNRMIDASSRIFDRDIYVDDTPGLSIMQLRSKVRHLKSKYGIGLVVVDYLQLMTYSGRAGNREEEVTKISQGIKAIAKEYDVPVLALAQLSRAVENRGGDKRPQLSDLRESGSIEQDADAVMFLYRPEYYGITTTPEGRSTDGVAEVLVKKQREGPVGMIPLRFIKKHAKFHNPSYKESEEGAPF